MDVVRSDTAAPDPHNPLDIASLQSRGRHGFRRGASSLTEPNGIWFEIIEPNDLMPPNLYEAQLQQRLGSQ